jgi:hypothetical protein
MRGEIDPDFQLSLTISLKQLPRHLVKAVAAAKLPHDSDSAHAALSAGIVAQLRLSGWNISAPPPPMIDMGR